MAPTTCSGAKETRCGARQSSRSRRWTRSRQATFFTRASRSPWRRARQFQKPSALRPGRTQMHTTGRKRGGAEAGRSGGVAGRWAANALSKSGRADAHLFAEMFRSDANLDYTGFVDTGNANILEDSIVYFALAGLLNHNLFPAGNQRPKCGCLRLFLRVRVEREVNARVGQVGASG